LAGRQGFEPRYRGPEAAPMMSAVSGASIWFGEYRRMHRVGRFIAALEARVNKMAGAELLSWESSLRIQQTHMSAPYSHTVTLIGLLGVFGTGIGLWFVTWPIVIKIAVASAQAIAHAVFYGRLFVALWNPDRIVRMDGCLGEGRDSEGKVERPCKRPVEVQYWWTLSRRREIARSERNTKIQSSIDLLRRQL